MGKDKKLSQTYKWRKVDQLGPGMPFQVFGIQVMGDIGDFKLVIAGSVLCLRQVH